MYDVIVLGQGMAGLIAAIRAREKDKRVALISKGLGKMIQSSGTIDLMPGTSKSINEVINFFQERGITEQTVGDATTWFKTLTKQLHVSYEGSFHETTPIVTGSGYLKRTCLYPKTISSLPEKGHIIVLGIDEIIDFQPNYVKENLSLQKPELTIQSMSVTLNISSMRGLSQVDVARMLDRKEVRTRFIQKIKEQMQQKKVSTPELFVFPACLGIKQSEVIVGELQEALESKVTEAPGLPPNATAVRLFEALRRHAYAIGVRFYENQTVQSVEIADHEVKSIQLNKDSNQSAQRLEVKGKQLVNATGGILGGGLKQTAHGLKDCIFLQPMDTNGAYQTKLSNVYHVGASEKPLWSDIWIPGGIYTISSSYLAIENWNAFRGGRNYASFEWA